LDVTVIGRVRTVDDWNKGRESIKRDLERANVNNRKVQWFQGTEPAQCVLHSG